MKLSRSLVAAAVVLAAAGSASVAQAHGSVAFSIGANIAPGVSIGATNAPYYYGPRYYAPYYAPAPVVVAPAPVYYQPAPAPVYYGPEWYDPVVGITYVWHPQYHRYYYMNHGRRVWHH